MDFALKSARHLKPRVFLILEGSANGLRTDQGFPSCMHRYTHTCRKVMESKGTRPSGKKKGKMLMNGKN